MCASHKTVVWNSHTITISCRRKNNMTSIFIICKGINVTDHNLNLLDVIIERVITLQTRSIIHYDGYDQKWHIQICKFIVL